MRKRSKIRISQETLPWVRVKVYDEELMNLFSKKASHWFNGNRRMLQTALLKASTYDSIPGVLNNAIRVDRLSLNIHPGANYKNNLRRFYTNRYFGKSKANNFCLFLGKSQTYNRKLFISRQALRKLVRTGLISGLQK